VLNKQAFNEYISKKLKSEKTINENLMYLDTFQKFLDEKGVSDLSDFTADYIAEFHKRHGRSGRWVWVDKFHKFMQHYAESIEKGYHDADNPEETRVADEIRRHYYKAPDELFEKYTLVARSFITRAKNLILPLPNEIKIDNKYLTELTNEQFVEAFRDLRLLIIDMYDNIYAAPFDWGYPDFEVSDEYRNRVNDVLVAMVKCGKYNRGVISVDAKKFFASTAVKRHKKVELMINGFKRFGFVIDGYDKKAEEFQVSHNENPQLIMVLNTYILSLDDKNNRWAHLQNAKNGYSYRFVEDTVAQEYETAFHAIMDYEPKELLKIQKWLHAEAAKCGYKIDPKEVQEKGMILYKKGSKRFLLAGYGYEKTREKIVSKVIFRNVFKTHKAQAERLMQIFPETFVPANLCGSKPCAPGGKVCTMGVEYELDGVKYKKCVYHSFWFKGVTLDNIGFLLKLFKLEYGIKEIEI